MVLILLFALVVLANGQTTAECIKKISESNIALYVPDAGAQETLVEAQCVAQEWLRELYSQSRDVYNKWMLKEQQKVAFKDVISKPSLYACYKAFAKASLLVENFEFYEAVKGYKSLVAPGDSAARRRDGCTILKTHIAQGSPKQINVNSTYYQTVIDAFAGKCDPGSTGDVALDVFDGCLGVVEKLMSQGSSSGMFGRFLVSPSFSDCPDVKTAIADMSNYAVLQQQYCADEKVAFRSSPERQQRSFKAILKGWAKNCASNPNFWPAELSGRARAPGAGAAPPPRAAGPSI